MSKFLVLYFVVYGGTHIYFFLKLRRAFQLKLRGKLLSGIILGAVFIAPLLARLLEKHGIETAAGLASHAGYWWMGLLFLFISASALLDLVRLVSWMAAKLLKRPPLVRVTALAAFLIPACYTVLIGIYGWNEAITIRTEQLTLNSSKIPPAAGRIRIALISDLHIGQIMSERRVHDVLDKVRAANPDLLLSAGDLVDGHQRHFAGIDKLFREINPPLGKIAIPGNHEYYVGIEESMQFMKSAGFRVLRDENLDLAGIMTITGMDDPWHGRVEKLGTTEATLLNNAPSNRFRLLLKHRPVLEKTSRGQFDLQFSGHVHKGQIFPFNFLTWLSFPVRAGLTRLGQDSALYVSRGTGVWGPPIRFLAPPEVTVIDLVAKQP